MFTIYLRLNIVVIITTLALTSVFSQWTVRSYHNREFVKYHLSPESVNKLDTDYCFVGNKQCGAITIDKVRESSKQVSLLSKLDHFGIKLQTKKYINFELPSSIVINAEQAHLSAKFYFKNVSQCILLGKDKHRGWIQKTIEPNREGYQLPFTSSLLTWEAEVMNLSVDEKDFEIDQLIVIISPKDKATNFSGYIGSLTLKEKIYQPSQNLLPWLDSLLGVTIVGQNKEKLRLDDYSDWSNKQIENGVIPTFEAYNTFKGYHSGLLDFQIADASANERFLLEKLLEQAIIRYPFYKEKSFNKDQILDRLKKQFEEGKGIGDIQYYKQLHDWLEKELNDPHFELVLPKSWQPTHKKGPIRISNIAGIPQVVAVFDQDYTTTLPIGSEVLALDGNLVKDNFKQHLSRTKEDSILITFTSPKQTKNNTNSISIAYDRPIKIGNNFRREHGSLKELENSIYYLHAKNWTGDIFYKFLNHRQELLSAKGLIIDLRGNGGGYTGDAYQTLSLFIEEVQILGQKEYLSFKESILLTPGFKEHALPPSLKVAILVNQNTACASELFIIGMKKRKNTFVIGDSRTLGAIASPTLLRFPSGAYIKMHYSFGKFSFPSNIYTEGKGLEPDIWVSRTGVQDLVPYKDKVLNLSHLLLSK